MSGKKKYRIAVFCTQDGGAGAARHTYRFHSLLNGAGHESWMYVREKRTHDERVGELQPSRVQHRLERFRRPWRSRGGRRSARYAFDFDDPALLDYSPLFRRPRGSIDQIWILRTDGILDTKTIVRLQRHFDCPVVFVMADYASITGGCHYMFGCERYQEGCGNCPQLVSSESRDASRLNTLRKQRAFADGPFVAVPGNNEGMEYARQSALFGGRPTFRLSWCIDESVYRPFDKGIARDLLHLPRDRQLIYFGAVWLKDPRKGMRELRGALEYFARSLKERGRSPRDEVALLITGAFPPEWVHAMPLDCHFLGSMADDLSMALVYQAADVYVCSSIQDAGPMMIPEAMMCGLPVVGFPTGHAMDLIENGKNGFLCSAFDPRELADGLEKVLYSDDRAAMGKRAREKVMQTYARDRFVANFEDVALRIEALCGDDHGRG